MRNVIDPLLLDSSIKFLKLKKVYRYHLKKISDMTDEDIIRVCHWYVWEHHLVDEFAAFRAQNEVSPSLLDRSRKFLAFKKVYRIEQKKIPDMTDEEIIRACQRYVWENHLEDEFEAFRAQNEDPDNTQKNQ